MPEKYLEEKLSEAYKETTQRVYLETFYHAICHDNIYLIEILIEKDFDITQKVLGKKSALALALEKQTAKVIEILLIISMRHNKHFEYKDLKKALEWCLNNRYHHLVEIVIYALKHKVTQDQSLINFISVRDNMMSLSDILKNKKDIPVHQMLNFKSLLSAPLLTKRQLSYLYTLWEKSFPAEHPQSLEIFHALADRYYLKDKFFRATEKKRAFFESFVLSPAILSGSFLVGLVNKRIYHYLEKKGFFSYLTGPEISYAQDTTFAGLFIALSLGFFIMIYAALKIFKESCQKLKKLKQKQIDRDLIYFTRQGNTEKVQNLVLSKKAQINTIAGIAESTPLFEAYRSNHRLIAQFLLDHKGFSMQGNQVY